MFCLTFAALKWLNKRCLNFGSFDLWYNYHNFSNFSTCLKKYSQESKREPTLIHLCISILGREHLNCCRHHLNIQISNYYYWTLLRQSITTLLHRERGYNQDWQKQKYQTTRTSVCFNLRSTTLGVSTILWVSFYRYISWINRVLFLTLYEIC